MWNFEFLFYLEHQFQRGDAIIPEVIGNQMDKRNNERMNAQAGLFLMPTTLRPTFWENLVSGLKLGKGQPTQMRTSQITDELTEKACVVKFVFNKHLMESAQLLLRDANLSSQALFPGLEGVAKSIT